MASFLAAKHFNSLRPADEVGESVLRGIKQGDLVSIEVRKPRNIKHHRMFWALMSLVYNNLDGSRYPTVEDLVAAIKIAVGLRTRIELPSGETGYIPGSIAFHKMDQSEFDAFYNRVCDLVVKHFLPGVTREELRHEVEVMTGMRS